MGTDVTEVNEESHLSCAIKVHHAMCTQLRTLIDRISRISPDIEAARPGCSAGIQALCLLQGSIGKANQLLENCSESSRFYLAITTDATVSRIEKIRKQLVQSLNELQSMVPMNLKLEISQIIEDLKRAIFTVESSEKEAGKVVRALLQKEDSILSSFENSELRAVQFCASRLHLESQKDLLVEKRSIRKMLDNTGENDRSKKSILKYLLRLMRTHDKLILDWQPHYPSITTHEESDRESQPKKESQPKQESQLPPEQFKCPLSTVIMWDPVVIASGHTFERVFIQKWFDDGHYTCPTTGMELNSLSLLPNIDMKNLILKWCKEHGIESYQAPAQLSAFGSLENSINSISSCNSLAGLNLQMDLSNVSLGSVDTSFNSGDLYPKNRLKSGLSRELSNESSQEFRNFSSSREIGTELLCNIGQLPWESQVMAIGDTQDYLEHNIHSHVPLSLKNFMDPAVGFLMTAVDRKDTKAQAACSQLILTGIRASRNAVRLISEDMYVLLASFLGTSITKDVLSIFELSVERNCGSKLAQSYVLSSILQILEEAQHQEFHESVITILYNLSLTEDSCFQKLPPGEFISRLIPFLSERSFSGRCIVILEKLFYVEEARVLAVQTEGCISAIVELLESGDCEEQEHALSILLSLCSQYEQCCKSAMVEGLIPSLFGIAVNGSEKAQVVASELLRLLRDLPHEDEEENYSYNAAVVDDDGESDDDANRISVKEEKKVLSKRTGFFGKVAIKLKKW